MIDLYYSLRMSPKVKFPIITLKARYFSNSIVQITFINL